MCASTPLALSPQLLRRLQLAELSIFRELVAVCDRNHLRYFVLGGTLLGAVRHGGFIPWDDDIDVGLPRPDFERLRREAVLALPAGLVWQSRETEAAFPFLFAKVGRTDTVLEDDETTHLNMRHCVSIDVFPLDGVPNSRAARKVHQWFLKFVRLRLAARLRHTGMKRLVAALLTLVPIGAAERLHRASWQRVGYDESTLIVNAGGAWGYSRETVPRAWLGPGRPVKFEGMEVCAPADSDAYLRHVYGDYSTLPPIDQRRTSHRIVRLEVPNLG